MGLPSTFYYSSELQLPSTFLFRAADSGFGPQQKKKKLGRQRPVPIPYAGLMCPLGISLEPLTHGGELHGPHCSPPKLEEKNILSRPWPRRLAKSSLMPPKWHSSRKCLKLASSEKQQAQQVTHRQQPECLAGAELANASAPPVALATSAATAAT